VPAHRFAREELLRGTPFGPAHRHEVRLQDVDAAGVVFFARHLEFAHDGMIRLLAAAGWPVPEKLAEGAPMAPLRHAEGDFLAPLRFGDAVLVRAVAAHLRETEIAVGFRLAREEDGTVVSLVQLVHVFVDPATFRRVPVPAPVRAWLRGEAHAAEG